MIQQLKTEEEIQKNRITVAVDDNNKCVGFLGVNENGCFGQFPYLAILSVHEQYRNQGIGKELLEHFENEGFAKENCFFSFMQ